MTEKMEIYKCEICGNIVEVLHSGAGNLVCCGTAMAKMEEQTADWSTEKHVPVVEEVEGGFLVKVGSTPHPMEEEHFIELIEIIQGDLICRKFLKPGVAAEATFKAPEGDVKAREYCNKHGLWKN